MSKGMFRVMLAAAVLSVLAVTMVFAADSNAPAAPKAPPIENMKGMVEVVKDANGVVAAVKLTMEMDGKKMSNNVILDREGMELAKMDGKVVEVKAIKRGTDLKVVSFKPADKPAGKPTGKPVKKTPPK